MLFDLIFVNGNLCYSLEEANSFGDEHLEYTQAVERYGRDEVRRLIKARQKQEEIRLEAEGWQYVPQRGYHADHWVSPKFCQKHNIPPVPVNGTVQEIADYWAHLNVPDDWEMRESGHVIYFP